MLRILAGMDQKDSYAVFTGDDVDPRLEREVQWDVRVHSSSCGAHLGVVHSPFGRLFHRCHCICRDHVLYVGRLPWLCGPLCCGGVCIAMSSGGGGFTPDGAYDSVWDSVRPMMSCGRECFSPDGAYDFAWDSVKPMEGKYTINYIQYPFRRWMCLHAQRMVRSIDDFAPTTTTTSSSS